LGKHMAIDHKTITDAEKHTPKGYPDTGSPGTNHVYQYNGSALEFGLVNTGNITSSAVTNDKVANGTLGAEKFQEGGTERAWVAEQLGINISPGSINIIPADGQLELINGETSYESYTYAISNSTRSYSVIIFGTGSVTIAYYMRTSDSPKTVNGRVLLNGSQVQSASTTKQGNEGGLNSSFTQAVKSGDVITFQCKEDGGQSNAVIMNSFEINADKYVPTYAGSVV